MSDNGGFAKLVPGFEFLQSLAKGAGASMPGVGHWVAPTLDPEEIDKRIEELRTVKFWLEQNGRLLDTTIQALEVQRMTLSTLQTMNVQMSDLRDAMMIRTPPRTPAAEPPPSPFAFAPGPAQGAPEPQADARASAAASTPDAGAAAPGAIDPMQWWGALTKQFATLATSALQSGAGSATAGLDESSTAAGKDPSPPHPAVKPQATTVAKDPTAARKKPARKTTGR